MVKSELTKWVKDSEIKAIKSTIRDIKTDDIDPKGYDFVNIVDDIEDIRKQHKLR